MKPRWKLYALALLAGVVLTACAPSSTFTVNSDADTDDGACNVADCTLREAINAANAAAPSPITISFDISGGGVHTIAPASPLPVVTKSVVIDGTSQPGYAGSPLIELNGTNAGGSADGLVLNGGSSTVRGLAINRFGNAAIVLGGSGGDKVAGNHLGTDPSGMTGMGNYIGVQVASAGNDIGGVTTADRNVIGGNSGPGVALGGTGSVSGNIVEGNYIGLDASATSALPNEVGVYVGSPGNIIGGKGFPAGSGNDVRNLISGNAADGILILSDNTQVLGNSIGVDADNQVGLGNGSSGVRIKTGNGSSIQSNFIAFNGTYGVSVQNGTGNVILYNSIHDNGNLGIAIDQGVVIPNDPGDPDTGANNRQNFPVLTSAVTTSTDSTFTGVLNSTLGTVFTVQFFTNASCDPSGYGEGHRLVKTISVTTDASGNAALTAYFPSTIIAPGNFITATATDPENNTSGFSNCIPVTLVSEPTATPSASASILGKVWHDLCALPDGPLPPSPPPGCIPAGGSYEANGILEPGEPGLANVTVRLGAGACPASGLATALTASDGTYTFDGLAPGNYCVSVGALIDGNDSVLIPGGWTYPVAHADPQAVALTLGPAEVHGDVNFGWDYQFLPAWPGATPTPTPAPAGFSAPKASVPKFYYRGAGCGPLQVELSIQSLDPNARDVVLFFRLKDAAGSQTTGWNDGVAMLPQGTGFYSFSLASASIPGFTTFPQAVLQYQFVAEGPDGQILGRSPVYDDVMLEVCHQ